MRSTIFAIAALIVASVFVVPAAHAQLSGAIFTTKAGGTEVNYNIYQDKNDVYLNGGPGPGAPQGAAGLPDGVYVFMVTDPSGKTLLSQDSAACRRVTVAAGIITGLVTTLPNCPGAGVTGLAHLTVPNSLDHNKTTVQLMPYADTPNHGGEYKAWMTPVLDYLCPTLTEVDCPSGTHGFVNADSKTDNFKIKLIGPEIDTRHHHPGGPWIDGVQILWTDTLGNSNTKWSYYDQSLDVNHEAHVEAAEQGVHKITILSQTLCQNPGNIYDENGNLIGKGPGPINVRVSPSLNNKSYTYRLDVDCN
jgi:hypothetical protein